MLHISSNFTFEIRGKVKVDSVAHNAQSNLLDQLNLKAFLQHMSESERESATTPSDINEEMSRETLSKQKTKHIKKERPSQSVNQNKLTKEERAKLQKEKNREAAQRSRDMHKQYVTRLEWEVRDLREQVESNRQLCFKCKQELNCSFFQENIKKEQMIDDQIFAEVEQPQLHVECNDMIAPDMDVAEYFLRVKKEEEEDYSYVKMMLFVAMIFIAVLIYPSRPDGRTLVELQETPKSQQIYSYSESMDKELQTTQVNNELTLEEKKISHNIFTDQKCLDSLIWQDPTTSSNLRGAYTQPINQYGLFCSFYQPQKALQSFPLRNSLTTLFLLGSDLQKMIASGFKIGSLINGGIQLHGVYQMTAEMRAVDLVAHHDCQL